MPSESTPSSTRRITVRAVNPLAPLATPIRVSTVSGTPWARSASPNACAIGASPRLVDADDPGEPGGLGHLPDRRADHAHAGAHCSLPSSTVARPRRNVATTRPGSSIPAYGVLRDRLADSVGSTVRRTLGS